jgi:hypothetical protein
MLRVLASAGMSREFVRRQLSLNNEEEASQTIQALERDGLIERRESQSFIGGIVSELWYLTIKGSALAGAPASKPIQRSTAAQNLTALLDRVKELRNRDFAYCAAEVAVFGSYLSGVDRLGDLDVAIRLVPKLVDNESHQLVCDERRKNATRSFSSWFDRLTWPEREVQAFLRARARSLAIRWEVDDFIWSQRFEIVHVDSEWAGGFLNGDHQAAQRPLILETSERLQDALKVQSAFEQSESEALRIISGWAKAGGYDAIVITRSALAKRPVTIQHPVALALTSDLPPSG